MRILIDTYIMWHTVWDHAYQRASLINKGEFEFGRVKRKEGHLSAYLLLTKIQTRHLLS